jgi:hypothetical protein
LPWLTIEEHFRRRSTPQLGDLIHPSLPKPYMVHSTQQIRPAHHVKGFGNVQFDEKGRNLLPVQQLDYLPDIDKTILNTPLFNESSMVFGYKML